MGRLFFGQPLPASHAFWDTKDITVLPHIGVLDVHRDEIDAVLFADNMSRFLAGEALVDRSRGY